MGISIRQSIDLIKAAPKDHIIGLVGAPGFGKSAAPRQAAIEQKWAYVCRYLALMEAVEINGLPYLTGEQGKWAPFAGLFPLATESHTDTLLCLDDLGQATPSVGKAGVRTAYGDGIERMVGMQHLHPSVRVCFTSNLHTHRAGAHRFESYVTNRVTLIEVEPDALEWVAWAISHSVNPIVTAWVRFTKMVTDFEPAKDAFMSPRSLHRLGEMIDALDAAHINGSTLRAVVNGTIGEQAGSEFLAYHTLSADLPDMDAVLSGDKVKLPTRPEVQYMFATTFIRAASEEHVPIAANLISRLTDVGGTGFEVAAFLTFECLKGSATKLRGISDTKKAGQGLYKWLAEYGKYLP